MFYYGLLLLQADVVMGLSQPHPKNVMDRRDALMVSTASMVTAVVGPATATVANAAYIDPENVKITQKVYMNVEFASNNKKGGKIVIGVYGDAMPRVTENFVTLCRNNQYAGTTFYRIISDVTVQGGAIGDPTGKTGQSSLDDKKSFEPDHYDIRHLKEGLVSMARAYDGSVDSRFFIQTARDAGWADDRYAAFGVVLEGMDLVHQMEQEKVQPPKNAPISPITIVSSGVL